MPERTRYQALDAARGLAILHMVWFHVHRWSASPSSIQRWRFSVDWWSLVILSAPPLFFLCFGCVLGMLPWQEKRGVLLRHLAGRALILLVCYKLLFLLELASLGAASGSYWPALTFAKTSGWVEVLSFYSFCLILLPPLIPAYLRLPMALRWGLFVLLWTLGLALQKWPSTPATVVPLAFLVGAPGMRPFPLLFWVPIVLIGVSLGQCWKQTPEKLPRLILIQALLLSLGVGWLGEGGFSWQDFHLNIVLNGWKHPPHLAYVGLESANALAWLAICLRLYGLKPEPVPESWGPKADLLRIGRHPLSIYIGHFVVLFGFNRWLHFHGWVQYETSLVLATLALAACIPFARWRDRQGRTALTGQASLAGVLLGLTLIGAVAIQSYPRKGPLSQGEFARLVQEISEPGGYFDSDNWVSNESAYLHVLDRLKAEIPPGRVYLGVGPEQNFTYIAELQPAYAFTIDIRRGNQLQHLFYKALFELSATPQEWLARLTGRIPQASWQSLTFSQWVQELKQQPPDPQQIEQTQTEVSRLMSQYEVRLQPGDWDFLKKMHRHFYEQSLGIRFTFTSFNPGTIHSSFEEILLATDLHGRQRNFLAVPESYQRVRKMQLENRILPIVGDFAGRHAMAEVAAELRRRNLLVGLFYLSNVEDYLMLQGLQDDLMEQFVYNLSGLPADEHSLLLRTHRFDIHRAQAYAYGKHVFIPRLQRLQRFVWRYQTGQLGNYPECMQSDALPLEVQVMESASQEE